MHSDIGCGYTNQHVNHQIPNPDNPPVFKADLATYISYFLNLTKGYHV